MTATTAASEFRAPTTAERAFNRLLGWLVAMGVGPGDCRVIEVRGRRTGKRYRTPVNVLAHGGTRYLVCPRGRAAWVRNAEATGEVTLVRGRSRRVWRLQALPVEQRAPVLKAYVMRYAGTVQRFFTVDAAADLSAFAGIAAHHPVYELLDPASTPGGAAA